MKYHFLALLMLIFIGCGNKNPKTPEEFAEKFCGCSEEMGKAIVKLKSDLMSMPDFQKAKREQESCMGPNDPRQSMSETEVMAFDASFLKAVYEKCPTIARNYGFKE
jgi:hypothetical protein